MPRCTRVYRSCRSRLFEGKVTSQDCADQVHKDAVTFNSAGENGEFGA